MILIEMESMTDLLFQFKTFLLIRINLSKTSIGNNLVFTK